MGVGDGQGGLECCGSRCHKELDTTEQLNWTDEKWLNSWYVLMVEPTGFPVRLNMHVRESSQGWVNELIHWKIEIMSLKSEYLNSWRPFFNVAAEIKGGSLKVRSFFLPHVTMRKLLAYECSQLWGKQSQQITPTRPSPDDIIYTPWSR